MAIVTAKCTQCGATIKIDEDNEAGICEYCGTAFITEKAINNYNAYVTNNNNFDGATINVVNGDIDNYIKLANNAIDAQDGNEALKYANRALELKADSVDAWLSKMKAMGLLSTVQDIKYKEICVYGNNAIEYASDEEKEDIEEQVYKYHLQRSAILMTNALAKMKDTDGIQRAFKLAGINLAAISAVQQTDNNNLRVFHTIADGAINHKAKVPEEYIAQKLEMQELVQSLSQLYIEFCNADVARMKIYGLSPGDEAQKGRTQRLEILKKGLSIEKRENVKAENIVKGKDACYIATCVYGSYDCPEVWTLRRFRDITLYKSLFGRAFIKCYYTISPICVKAFGKRIWFRKLWRNILDKEVSKLNDKGYDNKPYYDK